MKVSNISITNYRNFQSFSIDLKDFTLILGENNVGKTNLINAICLIFSQDISFYKKRYLEIEDINFKALKDFQEEVMSSKPVEEIKPIEVLIEVTLTDFTSPEHKSIVADWLVDNTLKKAKISYLFSFKSDFKAWVEKTRASDWSGFPIAEYESIIFGGTNRNKPIESYFLRMIRFDFLDALRDAKNQMIANGESKLLYKILSSIDPSDLSDVKEVLKNLEEKINQNPSLNEIKEQIQGLLGKTSLVENDLSNSVDFLFSNLESSDLLKKIEMIYGDNPIRIERNGLGRNNLLYIALVISHLINSKKNDCQFRMVAIEEPEAHLHPVLQEHLARSFQDFVGENLQIIVTTHSPHIASNLSLEHTLSVFRDQNNKVMSNYILGNFSNTAQDKKTVRYLQKFLDATKSSMFFSRKIIFVEGIAEQLLIPVFFKLKFGQTLEKHGIVVVNVNGVSFRNFLEVISRNVFIKALVLTDSDAGTKTKDRPTDLKDDFSRFSHILVKITDADTFEKDIISCNAVNPDIILDSLKRTRPNSGGDTFASLFRTKKDIESFFDLIDEYKSDFSFNLSEALAGKNAKDFSIPSYIQEGFDFLIEDAS